MRFTCLPKTWKIPSTAHKRECLAPHNLHNQEDFYLCIYASSPSNFDRLGDYSYDASNRQIALYAGIRKIAFAQFLNFPLTQHLRSRSRSDTAKTEYFRRPCLTCFFSAYAKD